MHYMSHFGYGFISIALKQPINFHVILILTFGVSFIPWLHSSSS